MKHFVFLFVMLVCAMSQPAAAQTKTSSQSIKAGDWAVHVPYDISDPGEEYTFDFGPGGWAWDFLSLQQRNLCGKDNISIERVGFTGRYDQSYTSLSTTQTTALDTELDVFTSTGITKIFLLCGVGNEGTLQGSAPSSSISWDNTYRNNYVNDIVRAVEYVESKGYTVFAVAPFNEPDYESSFAGNASNFNSVASIMQSKEKLKGKVFGPSCLNSTESKNWYSTVKNNINYANTHQLAGTNFTDWTGFWQTANADGIKPVADEMHNVMEAMACVHYGGVAGTWWGWEGITRAEYVRIVKNGTQLAYIEKPDKWMIATVNKYNTGGRVEAFIGTSERQAVASDFTFQSLDRLVYYDGKGPVYDYTQHVPGGASGSYQNGQTNAERVINVNYGEDVPIEPVSGEYYIVNRNSGKVLSIYNGDASASGYLNVYQWTQGGLNNQVWVVERIDSLSRADYSYVSIKNKNTSSRTLYIDAPAWNMNAGGSVGVYDGDNGKEATWQRWHLRYVGDGYFNIINHMTGFNLEVYYAGTNDGQDVIEWTDNGHPCQQWKFVPVENAPLDMVAPAAPTGLTATGQSGSVRLNWNPNSENDICGYMIYRYNSELNIWECIGRKVTGNSFIDNTCRKNNQSIRYKIKALDKSYNFSAASAEATAQITTEHSMVAHYLGSSANDATDNKLNAATNGITYGTYNSHQSMVFDGSNHYAELPYYIGDFHSMTFAAWVRFNQDAWWQRIFDFANTTNSYLFLSAPNGGNLRFEIKANDTTQGFYTNNANLATNTWYHVALTIGPDKVAIYINGTLNASSTDITLRPDDVAPTLAYLGRSIFDADPAFKGYLSDVRIYNYDLNEEEVLNLYGGIDITLAETEDQLPENNPISGVNVKLNRTIGTTTWNTICLPFDMSEAQVRATFGTSAQLLELYRTNTNGTNTDMYFMEATSIEANVPYLMKNASAGSTYTFTGVNYQPSKTPNTEILDQANGDVTTTFCGTYYRKQLNNADGQDYYIVNDHFKHSTGNTIIKGFRAYFNVKDESGDAGAKQIHIMTDDGEITGIVAIDGQIIDLDNSGRQIDDTIYDLSGRAVKNISTGIYIVNGKKVIK